MSHDRRRAAGHRPRLLSFLVVVLALGPAAVRGEAQVAAKQASADGAGRGEAGVAPAMQVQRIESEGVAVEMRVHPLKAGSHGRVRELEEFEVSLTITDAETGDPMREMYPATWVDFRLQDAPTAPSACETKVAGYVRGTLRMRPVVDLNSYFLLTLTRGPQIAVINPLISFGSSQLYTTVLLPGTGADWAQSPDGREIFVSIPKTGQVSVVETEDWEVVGNIDAGTAPTRVTLHPDGRSLWVTNEAAGAAAGVTVIDVATRTVLASIATGAGPHTLAFAPDRGLAFVANEGDGTVTAIDAETLARIRDIETGPRPADVVYSSRTGEAYVADREDGTLATIDARSLEVVDRLQLDPGLHLLRLIPGAAGGHAHHGGMHPSAGRVAIVLNRETDVAYIVDVMDRRMLRSFEVFDSPDQIAFSSSFAYIRSANSPQVTTVPLDDPTSGGVGAYDHFPAGQQAPAEAGPIGVANAMVQAPDMPDAVYVVNPGENALYYYHYMEGMPTPSGSVGTYGFEPTSVMLVARRLREDRPGIYSANVKVEDPGRYEVVFLLPEPRIIHCFPFTVVENPALRGDKIALRLQRADRSPLPVGGTRARFRLYDGYTREPKPGVEDMRFHLMATNGWQKFVPAVPVDGGTYEINVSFPSEGIYYLSYEVPSLGVGLRDNPPLMLRVVDDGRSTR